MSQEHLSHRDRLRAQRRADESFVRTYTRHGKKSQPLSQEDQATMEFFNGIQRELQLERMKAIYAEHDQ